MLPIEQQDKEQISNLLFSGVAHEAQARMGTFKTVVRAQLLTQGKKWMDNNL